MKNNIILIGMRGSGKTVVSKILSEKLELPLIDTDQFIVQQDGMTIKEMTDKNGWDYFRDKETSLLKNLQSRDKFILSTGGGIITRSENYDLLHELGVMYYLYARPEVLAARIKEHSDSRPKLTDSKTLLEDLERVFKQRKKLYDAAADHVIHTEKISPKEVADTILAYYLIANV